MAVPSQLGQAYNRTREAYLATQVELADTYWTRLRGLLGRSPDDFRNGAGLWIVPCHGVHTLGMGFAIDVLYLDRHLTVIHIQPDLQPWRIAPVRRKATSVLELPSRTTVETKTQIGDTIEITVPSLTTLPA